MTASQSHGLKEMLGIDDGNLHALVLRYMPTSRYVLQCLRFFYTYKYNDPVIILSHLFVLMWSRFMATRHSPATSRGTCVLVFSCRPC